MGTVKGVDWTRFDRTLVLALKIGCHFCEESTPFYKKLVEMRNSGETDVHMAAVFPDDDESVREYFTQRGLKMDAICGIPPAKINVSGTPTLILVNREGRVIKTWVGKLSAGEEEQVTASIKTLDWNPTKSERVHSRN